MLELLPSPEIDENLLAAERLENLRGTMLADEMRSETSLFAWRSAAER